MKNHTHERERKWGREIERKGNPHNPPLFPKEKKILIEIMFMLFSFWWVGAE